MALQLEKTTTQLQVVEKIQIYHHNLREIIYWIGTKLTQKKSFLNHFFRILQMDIAIHSLQLEALQLDMEIRILLLL